MAYLIIEKKSLGWVSKQEIGRHLPFQVVDIDLGLKSDIYFIVVTLICIDYFGFSNKKYK